MKVKNEYVEIKNGNKTYIRKNMILDRYIKNLFSSQITTEETGSVLINDCFIKLDTPLENVDYDTNLTSSDFDITLYGSSYNYTLGEEIFKETSVLNKNSIKATYNFSNEGMFLYNGNFYSNNEFEMFSGRKITAIGFGFGIYVLAYLDTTNMNIVINGNENLSIVRVDKYESDGICKGMDFPLHLVNDIAHYEETEIQISEYEYIKETTRSILYSVGFGNTLGLMEEEYLIGDLETVIDDNSITFDLTRTKKVGHYPSKDLQLGFYPTMDNSKYLVFKYRLYRRDGYGNVTYLNRYYTMSMLNENFGNLEIKLKIERS